MTRAFTADRRRVAGARLVAQGIARPLSSDPVETVRRMLAMQAQDYAGARWSIGLRTEGATDSTVSAALDSGALVRSWPMRGTLHITAPDDLGWMLSLTAQRTLQSAAGRHRALGLTDDDLAVARRTAARVLADGPVQRKGLLAAFEADGQSVAGLRGAHIIVALAVTRAIVFGPLDGAQHTFVDYDARVPAPRITDRDEALAEFVGRYLTAHGPASIRDFAWWSSLTLTGARRGLAAVRERFESFEVDGEELFHAPALESSGGVFALPGFDELLLGYQDRSASLHLDHAERIVPGGNGMFMPTVIVDGEVVGTWRRGTAKALRIELEEFTPMSAKNRSAFTRAARRYGEFVGRSATVAP
jgi:hypothetical protein